MTESSQQKSDSNQARRVLSLESRRALVWGSPLLTFSLAGVALISLGLLVAVMLYDVGFSSWRREHGELIEVPTQISRIETVRLPSGAAKAAIAGLMVNDTQLEVRGFGPRVESSSVGDAVSVMLTPKQAEKAFIAGYWSSPTDRATLLKIASLFYVPCLGWGVLVGIRGRRLKRLLLEGTEKSVTLQKSIPLPRPLFDYHFARWKDQDKKSFWTLTPKSMTQVTLLTLGRQRGFLESILSKPRWDGPTLHSDSPLAKTMARVNFGLLVAIAVILFAFLAT